MDDFNRRTALRVAAVAGSAALLSTSLEAAQGGVEAKPLVLKDYSKEQLDELAKIKTTSELCEKWKTVRPILVAAQGILTVLYPAAAKAIGLVIAFVDAACGPA